MTTIYEISHEVMKITEEASGVNVVELVSAPIKIAEVVEQGPAGPPGASGGISTLEEATDFNPAGKTDGSVLEFNQSTGTYEMAKPIANRQINGGYF